MAACAFSMYGCIGFQLKEGRASDVAKRKRADPGGGPAAKRSVLMGELAECQIPCLYA